VNEENIPTIDEGDAAASAGVPVLDDAAADNGLPARAMLQEDGSVDLPLLRPVVLKFRKTGSGDIREETFVTLRLSRLTGADMNAISSVTQESRASMSFARSARMAPGKMKLLYDQMDGADVMAVAAVIGFFLGNGATTGR
jgi:hypothetical protein